MDEVSGTARRARGAEASAYCCQKKQRPLANGCTTWWGGSGKRPCQSSGSHFLSLSLLPGVLYLPSFTFYSHKGCIHLNREEECRQTAWTHYGHLAHLWLVVFWGRADTLLMSHWRFVQWITHPQWPYGLVWCPTSVTACTFKHWICMSHICCHAGERWRMPQRSSTTTTFSTAPLHVLLHLFQCSLFVSGDGGRSGMDEHGPAALDWYDSSGLSSTTVWCIAVFSDHS